MLAMAGLLPAICFSARGRKRRRSQEVRGENARFVHAGRTMFQLAKAKLKSDRGCSCVVALRYGR